MQPAFSRRTDWETAETPWARSLRERRLAGDPVLDLTASNPTRCEFDYDPEALLGPLRNTAALTYDPDPRGLPAARQAVVNYYGEHGATLDPDHLFLNTSTSEAYSFLFRLLCDPGDEVLIAQPSYPLFDFLAALDDVKLISYPLFYDQGWHLDPQALKEKITSRTKAIVVVHPNNPTGHFTKPEERAFLEEVCEEYGLALIVDEVFLDYAVEPTGETKRPESFISGAHPVLTFVLSGLSKIAGIPQMKSAWIACIGPSTPLKEAVEKLEIIADTFLSGNAPVQHAMPSWLATRSNIQHQIRARTATNLATADRLLAKESVVSRLEVEAGWSLVFRVPATIPDEVLAVDLLQQFGVAIHSGHFFGFPSSGWLVASTLTQVEDFAQGVRGLVDYWR